MTNFGLKNTLPVILSLFTSAGTLVCCALPALFVSLGMGAVLAGLTANMPWLIWLSEHKIGLFITAAILLVIAFVMMRRAQYLPCPADPQKAKACTMLRRISWGILYLSIALYLIGFFFAFIAVKIF